jgi:hypothetical protein
MAGLRRKAMSVFAYAEAIRLLDRALDVQRLLAPEDKEVRYELLVKLEEALIAAGERERLLAETAPAALALAEALDDRRRAFAACRPVLDLSRSGRESAIWLETAERYTGADREARIRSTLQSRAVLHQGRSARPACSSWRR